MRGCRQWAKGRRGWRGGASGRLTHHPAHTGAQADVLGSVWTYSTCSAGYLYVSILCGVLGVSTGRRSRLLTSRGQSQISNCMSDSPYPVFLSTMAPSPSLFFLSSLNNEQGLQGVGGGGGGVSASHGSGQKEGLPECPTGQRCPTQGPGQYKATDDPKVLRGPPQISLPHSLSVCAWWLKEEPYWLSEEERPPCPRLWAEEGPGPG